MALEAPGEVHLSGSGVWEFPLSRSEKLQRLLNLFEAEAEHFASEADSLREEVSSLRNENAALRSRLLLAEGRQSEGDSSMVEADIGSALQGGSGTIRGPPELVAATLAALKTSQSIGSCPALATRRRPRNSSTWQSCRVMSAPASGDSSPASTPDTSPSESHFPMPPDSLQEHLRQELGPGAIGSKLKLPGLGLDRLDLQVAATPCSYIPAIESTPSRFSIRTPPGSTPRVCSLVTPSSRQQCLGIRSPTSAVAATPRSLSRICSLVTPRSGFGTSCAVSTGQRSMATMQQLAEVQKVMEQLVSASFDEIPAEDGDYSKGSEASGLSEASKVERLVTVSFDEMPAEDRDGSKCMLQ